MNARELQAVASTLAGEPVGLPEPVRGGGNNRLFRCGTASGGAFALKCYPGDPGEAAERLGREYGGLSFLWSAGERRIPQPAARDDARALALYAWLDGPPGLPVRAGDADDLAAFALALFGLRTDPAAAGLPPAREAVFSNSELDRQIELRLQRLEALEEPSLRALLADIRRLHGTLAGGPGDVVEPSQRTLSPSDFGLHNAIRTAAGTAYVDFEYFGWDDPVKLAADVVWHPGMDLAPAQRQRFYARLADGYNVDPTFASRFARRAPAYGLRWALIVLNEYLPAVWLRRATAGRVGERRAVLEQQRARAAALVERVGRGAVLT